MRKRWIARLVITAALLSICGAQAAQARYRYRPYGSTQERGLFVKIEALFANPRNTDGVVATLDTASSAPGGVEFVESVLPDWSDELAGRLAVGYDWSNGNRIVVGLWSFESDQRAMGDGPTGGLTHFAIGPPIFTGTEYVGDNGSPGFYDITSEISANTVDVAWGREAELADAFDVEWSLGLRFASFEETLQGRYDERDSASADFGVDRFDARKINEGEMIGVRAALRATLRLSTRLSTTAGLGFSYLDGEVNGSSTLTPSGSGNSGLAVGFAAISDDGRSGAIRDLDVSLIWHAGRDRYRVIVGWEQSRWEEIAADLVRNFPGSSSPLRDRDAVVFSGYKLGLWVRF